MLCLRGAADAQGKISNAVSLSACAPAVPAPHQAQRRRPPISEKQKGLVTGGNSLNPWRILPLCNLDATISTFFMARRHQEQKRALYHTRDQQRWQDVDCLGKGRQAQLEGYRLHFFRL